MSTQASIYRMVTPKHLCPWGLKALDLLKRRGFQVEDHHLKSEEENERYNLEKRDLSCACVGGGSQVPLGFISLTENVMMMVMAIWMLAR